MSHIYSVAAAEAHALVTTVLDICRHNDLNPSELSDRVLIRYFLNERGYRSAFLDEHLAIACEQAASRRQLSSILGGLGDALGTAIILGGGLLAYSLLTAPIARSAEAVDRVPPSALVASAEGVLALVGLGVIVGFVFGFLCAAVTGFWKQPENAPRRPCTNPDCPEATVSLLTPNVWHGL